MTMDIKLMSSLLKKSVDERGKKKKTAKHKGKNTPGRKFRKKIYEKSYVNEGEDEEKEEEMEFRDLAANDNEGLTVEEAESEARDEESTDITLASESDDDWEHFSDFFQMSDTTDSDWM